jgi:hypothetical protein
MTVSGNLQKALNAKMPERTAYPHNDEELERVKAEMIGEGLRAWVSKFNNGTKAKPIEAHVVRGYKAD